MKKSVLAGAAVAALVSTAAIAQQGPRPAAQPLTRDAVSARVEASFARLDANRDGAVTQDEIRARAEARRGERTQRREHRAENKAERQEQRQEHRAALFARLDANRDGSISRAEFDSPPQLSREQRAERREARGDRRSERRGARAERRGHGGGLFAGIGARRFAAADVNKDGRLTQAEALQGALAQFDRFDTDRNGTISGDERRSAREALGGERQQRRRG